MTRRLVIAVVTLACLAGLSACARGNAVDSSSQTNSSSAVFERNLTK